MFLAYFISVVIYFFFILICFNILKRKNRIDVIGENFKEKNNMLVVAYMASCTPILRVIILDSLIEACLVEDKTIEELRNIKETKNK